jgi:Methyltransferase domain
MIEENYRNLLIGCGYARDKRLEPMVYIPGTSTAPGMRRWRGELQTLDYESPCQPDIVWDLEHLPWSRWISDDLTEPLADDSYDEIHAYEVLEHLGRQGDYRAFFATFAEIWRLLKADGYLCATCPSRKSQWLWGDPGHCRVILPCSLVFLSQRAYADQAGHTTMSDYRRVYRADFETVNSYDDGGTHQFILRAVKPSRCPT